MKKTILLLLVCLNFHSSAQNYVISPFFNSEQKREIKSLISLTFQCEGINYFQLRNKTIIVDTLTSIFVYGQVRHSKNQDTLNINLNKSYIQDDGLTDIIKTTIAHESIHLCQIFNDRLYLYPSEACIRFRGRLFFLKEISYFDCVWELEANKKEVFIMDIYNNGIN